MERFIIDEKLEKRVASAIEFFWNTRSGQINRQNDTGIHDQGNRGAVTGGKQLDGFVDLIKDILIENGVPERFIFSNSNVELPGYYRPNKKWDLLVVDKGELIIAIEFKSQVGPSFGNNFNNRTEEAMGSAVDIWTAYREGVFGNQKAPWLGYFMVLEDCKKSNEPVRIRSPHFNVLDEFIDSSYKERYTIFCNKLLLERQYNSACLITSGQNQDEMFYGYPDKKLSFIHFVKSMLAATASHF